jgi:hypothetical protein
MAAKLSDPNWWPAPPQKPPQTVSTSAIAVGGIVALLVAAGIAFAVLGPRSHHHSTADATVVRSLTTFESCLKDQGVLTPSAESNDAMLRPAAAACRAYVPLAPGSRDPSAAAQRQLDECLQTAQTKLRNSASSLGSVGGALGNVS